jgi:hypothetical protein
MWKTMALVALFTVLGGSAAEAHRYPGTGGRVKVRSSTPNGAGDLVVKGILRLGNKGDSVKLRCRVEVTTTYGRSRRTGRQIYIRGGDRSMRRWSIRFSGARAQEVARRVAVPHCHAA